MPTAAVDPNLIVGLITLMLGGTGVGGLIAYRKVKPETESINVRTTLEVNEDQRKVIKRQTEEIQERDAIIDKLEARLASMRDDFIAQIKDLEREVTALRHSDL